MKFERGMGVFALLFSILVIGAFIAFSIYLIRLDNIIREKFEGQRWDIPAKVFARPLEVYANAPVNQADFVEELKMLGYKNQQNYDKSGSYVTENNRLFVHTRGFDYGENVDPEQVIEVAFNDNKISDVRATKPSSTGMVRLEPLLIGGNQEKFFANLLSASRLTISLQGLAFPYSIQKQHANICNHIVIYKQHYTYKT